MINAFEINALGPFCYSSSKCTLGMITSISTQELINEEFTMVAVHSGIVTTDMRLGLNLPGAISDIQSIETADSILNNILFAKENLNEKFIAWNGDVMP
ncbi:unnamed protein product [Adineta steineri]|uniref:Uncharacterized protein n=1 Tax=Adineta steineri TaxID=433720 RepID=A0A814FHZ5_9BILA|nr:unnamed protein product [Adineta steineri]CAF0981596.1 unnamed protein product [Adineta steineri]CAF3482678.1 unnamed protein product [Adineta steineri]CAF3702061.1 unnamed protein product [Adineta steineri]